MLDYESKQSIQPRMGKRSNDETRKPSGARFGEFNFRLVIARIDPTQLAIFGNDDAVGIGRNRIVEDSSHFRAHFRAFDYDPKFGIQVERPRIEIERSDEHRAAIDREGFGMKGRSVPGSLAS